jgi:hypothetical protein
MYENQNDNLNPNDPDNANAVDPAAAAGMEIDVANADMNK